MFKKAMSKVSYHLELSPTESQEDDGHELVLLEDLCEHLVGDLLDGGGVPLLDQPPQQTLLVLEVPLVQEGDVVLVVDQRRGLLETVKSG